MNINFDDIKNYFKYPELNKIVKRGKMGLRKKEAISVEYLFEIVNPGVVPPETVKSYRKEYHGLDDNDRIWYYVLDDINDCLDLLMKICNHFDSPISTEEESQLRKEHRNANNLLLFIIERAIYKA